MGKEERRCVGWGDEILNFRFRHSTFLQMNFLTDGSICGVAHGGNVRLTIEWMNEYLVSAVNSGNWFNRSAFLDCKNELNDRLSIVNRLPKSK